MTSPPFGGHSSEQPPPHVLHNTDHSDVILCAWRYTCCSSLITVTDLPLGLAGLVKVQTLNVFVQKSATDAVPGCHLPCYHSGPPWVLLGPGSSGHLGRWSFSQSPGILGQVWAERANVAEIRFSNLIPKSALAAVGQTLGNLHHFSVLGVCFSGHRES